MSADLSLFIELEDSLLTDEKISACFVDVHYVELVSANADGSKGTLSSSLSLGDFEEFGNTKHNKATLILAQTHNRHPFQRFPDASPDH